MDELKQFGSRVRAVRKAARVTQEQIAEKVRLNPKYLGEIARGEKRPSFEAILALSRALKVSPAVFFDFEQAETDEKSLRRRIEALLQKSSTEQLRKVLRLLRAFLEP